MNILMPLSSRDYDPTEAGVAWKILTEAGHTVWFATPDGLPAQADPLMLSGQGLDPWGCLPGIRRMNVVGLMLRAQAPAREAHAAMIQAAPYLTPFSYELAANRHAQQPFDALVLPGGHAKGMRAYLESTCLQNLVARFFDHRGPSEQHRPVAAVCHGVLLAARSRSAITGRSVLHGRRTTALTWAMERSAWNLTRWFARFWDPAYYRTYEEGPSDPAGYWSVEAEVKRALAQDADFCDVPPDAPHPLRKTSGLFRDHANDSRSAWVVRDGRYLSARWPGDVHTWAQQFAALLNQVEADSSRIQ
ncbi:MAG TPA: type 1 glutamine amidotransferase domain-containing protein [Aquabacterium sp.]|nr:type 1 glutamine amidotransferase domain-containing protein [Aquabacterium sp.]